MVTLARNSKSGIQKRTPKSLKYFVGFGERDETVRVTPSIRLLFVIFFFVVVHRDASSLVDGELPHPTSTSGFSVCNHAKPTRWREAGIES